MTHNPLVLGSSPSGPTNKLRYFLENSKKSCRRNVDKLLARTLFIYPLSSRYLAHVEILNSIYTMIPYIVLKYNIDAPS